MDKVLRGQVPKQVDISQYQGVLGDESHRLPELRSHLQTPAGQLELALSRLIAVGDPGQGYRLRHPVLPSQEFPEQLGGVFFDQDLGLEVKTGVVPEELVGLPGIAIATTVGASTIWVDAIPESHVGAVILGDNALGTVRDILGRRFLKALQIVCVVFQVLEVDLVVWTAEPVWGVNLRATSLGKRSFGVGHRSTPGEASGLVSTNNNRSPDQSPVNLRLKGKQDRRQKGHDTSPKKSKIRRKITTRKRIKSRSEIKSRTSCTRPKNAGSIMNDWKSIKKRSPSLHGSRRSWTERCESVKSKVSWTGHPLRSR